ncbi:hypothetical protein [Halalkalibacterium halodurans]|uniref:hypothetical protein n=1 Tax=Halalkalibacterium halodurans TaxID=86665 RepID=UPI002E227F82|nr:hypothetical protein [Halalkalibacterium halodurans]
MDLQLLLFPQASRDFDNQLENVRLVMRKHKKDTLRLFLDKIEQQFFELPDDIVASAGYGMTMRKRLGRTENRKRTPYSVQYRS